MPDVVIAVIVSDTGNIHARRLDGKGKPSPELPVRFGGLDRELVRYFERQLADNEFTPRGADLRMIGSLLHRCLFTTDGAHVQGQDNAPSVWTWIHQQLENEPDVTFRLELRFPADGEFSRLAAVPWEYLYRPDTEFGNGWFLAAHRQIVLSRYIPHEAGEEDFPPIERLRILVVISDPDPDTLGPVEYEQVLGEIKKTAEVLDYEVAELKNPTAGQLREAVTSGTDRPHLLHFMGHGKFDSTVGRGNVALLNPNETIDWVEDTRLAELVSRDGMTPRVIILHSCEGAKTDFEASFAGLAPQLVRAGVQCVIAMHYPVTNDTATAFSVRLYQELAKGADLDTAVQEARWHISNFGQDEIDPKLVGVPVIYLQSRNPLLTAATKGSSAQLVFAPPPVDQTEGWEFRFTLSENRVECEYDSPGRGTRPLVGGELRRGVNGSRLQTIEVLENWLKRYEWIAEADRQGQGSALTAADRHLLVPETFRELGNQLFWLAMQNPAGSALISALSTRGSRVRLRISFKKGAEELAAHPWEFLHDPESDRFLATETSLVLGRYLADEGDSAPIRCADNKVRVLFIVSLPMGGFGDTQRYQLSKLIEKLNKNPKLEVQTLEHWDAKDVEDRITEFNTGADPGPVDVVHFIGLCKIEKDQPKLHLPADGGLWGWIDPKPVVDALTANPTSQPAMVVLHLSDWQSDVPAHFEKVAPHFVKRGISAVMAMQYPMAPESGWEFVENLYGQLAKGVLIGEAVQSTRKKLQGKYPNNRHFGTPVLYMQSKVDGALIQQTIGADAGDEAPDQAIAETPGRRVTEPKRKTVDIKGDLFDVIDDFAPTDARNAIDKWVTERPWPVGEVGWAELDEARTALRSRKWESSIDAGPIFDRMLGVIAGLMKGAAQ